MFIVYCNRVLLIAKRFPSVVKLDHLSTLSRPTATSIMENAGVKPSLVSEFRANFDGDNRYKLARNACTKHGPMDIARKRLAEEQSNHVFTHKVATEGKPVTNQRSSGRCWIFAVLNCMRLPFCKQMQLEDFEFSQSYVFFWDKIERFNYLMHTFVEITRKGEPTDGRLVSHLTTNPSEDGGQWDMLVNLIEKYGVMPRKCFPDSWSSESSTQMKVITNSKMRQYFKELRDMVEEKKTDAEIEKAIANKVEELFRILSVCLGTPSETFTWEFYNKNKEYKKIGPITPLDFYKEHVKPIFNLEDKVVLTNDPRPQNSYDKLYSVEYLNNMTNGRQVLYINEPISVLKEAAAASIKDSEAVWFGCDVNKKCSWKKHGLEDLQLYDYDLLFGTNIHELSKSDRLIYGDSLMTHAMVLTAITEQDDNKITKWRVENSWGEDGGEKGYIAMTDDWFSEFVYEVVVDKKYIPDSVKAVLETKVIMLPAWDPMGALA